MTPVLNAMLIAGVSLFGVAALVIVTALIFNARLTRRLSSWVMWVTVGSAVIGYGLLAVALIAGGCK